MLTKDLLQFSHRKGKIIPLFIEERRPALQSLASELVNIYRSSVGKSLSEIERASATIESRENCSDGLRKLLLDRCEFADLDDSICEKRWELFRVAQELRDEDSWGDAKDYGQVLSSRNGEQIEDLRKQLFADHPDERRCEGFENIEVLDLLAEYNRAQLQTIFIFADDVKITVQGATLPEKRAFFRQLKFHSLMSEVAVDPDDASMTVYLSGPLKLFQKSTTYGLRLARFILNVLHFKKWEIEATVQLKNKRLQLKLDQDIEVKPRGRGLTGYVPEEFLQIMNEFNDLGSPWSMNQSEDFVHLGKQNYCFPDFDLVSGKKRIHFELFHPWHKGQLTKRLEAAATSKFKNYTIGVDRSLLKDKDLKSFIEKSTWFAVHGFEFNQFPTPKQILKVLEKEG